MILKKYMSFSLLSLMLSSTAYAIPNDSEIYVRNTHASFAYGGICSLAFDITAYDALNNIEYIKFNVTMKDKNGKLIARDEVTTDDLNVVGSKTHGRFFIESESACNAFGETLNIDKAIVVHNDGTKPEDIVKSKRLKVDNFKPMKILINGK